MQESKFSLKTGILIGGTYVAWCMGAGFASGQDSIQSFAGFGVMGYVGIVIAMLLHVYIAISFMNAGLREKFEGTIEVYNYYAGKHGGKILWVMAIGFTFLSPTTLIAAFGGSLNQHFGTPEIVGNIAIGILCIVTIIAGLKNIVNIIGRLAPIIVVVAIITSIVYISQNWEGISYGMKIATTTQQYRIGVTWFDAAINYTTWAPLVAAPFMASVAATMVNNKKEIIFGGVLAAVLYGTSIAMLVTAFFCNYVEASSALIPTLFMASEISQTVTFIFIVCIFIAIYTSAVPEFTVLTTMFSKSGTKKFKIIATIAVSAATLTTMILPYDQLFNIVYSFYGYAGMVIFILVVIKDIKVYRANKK